MQDLLCGVILIGAKCRREEADPRASRLSSSSTPERRGLPTRRVQPVKAETRSLVPLPPHSAEKQLQEEYFQTQFRVYRKGDT